MADKPFDRLRADSNIYAMFYSLFLTWDTLNTQRVSHGSFLDFSLTGIIDSLIELVPNLEINRMPSGVRINRFLKDISSLVAEHTSTPFHCKASPHTVYAKKDARYTKVYYSVISFYPGPEEFSFHYRVNSLGDVGYLFKEPSAKKEITALYVETQKDKILMEFNDSIATSESLNRYKSFINKLASSSDFEYSPGLENFMTIIEAMQRKVETRLPVARIRPAGKEIV